MTQTHRIPRDFATENHRRNRRYLGVQRRAELLATKGRQREGKKTRLRITRVAARVGFIVGMSPPNDLDRLSPQAITLDKQARQPAGNPADDDQPNDEILNCHDWPSTMRRCAHARPPVGTC